MKNEYAFFIFKLKPNHSFPQSKSVKVDVFENNRTGQILQLNATDPDLDKLLSCYINWNDSSYINGTSHIHGNKNIKVSFFLMSYHFIC